MKVLYWETEPMHGRGLGGIRVQLPSSRFVSLLLPRYLDRLCHASIRLWMNHIDLISTNRAYVLRLPVWLSVTEHA